MKTTSDLFDLIKSLASNEKRYFKLYATSIGGKENGAYMRLFNAMDTMQLYDEKLLKEKFKNEAFAKQFSVAKNYLFHIILKSLVLSSVDSNEQLSSYFSVMEAEVLYGKGLLEACSRQIQLTKKDLIKYEDKCLLDRVYEIEARIQTKKYHFDEAIKGVWLQEQVTESKLLGLRLKRVAIELFAFIQSNGNLVDESLQLRLEEMIQPVKDISIPLHADTITRYYYYTCFNFYYGVLRKPEKRLEYAQKVMDVLEANLDFVEVNTGIYFSAYSNLCQALLGINDFKRVSEKLREMRKSPFISNIGSKKQIRIEALASIINTEVLLYINNRNFSKTDELINEVKDLLQREKKYVGNFFSLELNFNASHLLFLAKKFDKALDFIRNTLSKAGKTERPDLYFAGRLLELLLLYETNSSGLLANVADTTIKFLKRSNALSKFDSLLIQYLRLASKKTSLDMLLELNSIYKLSGSKRKGSDVSLLSGYVDIEFWLQEEMKK